MSAARVLALAALPNVVIMAAVSVACVEQRMRRVVVIYGIVSAMVVGLTAVLLPVMGLIGAGVAWAAATTLTAAALLPRRDLWYPRERRDDPPTPADAVPDPTPPQRPQPQSLTVIVCAFTMDRWDDVCAAIGSLRRQTRRPEQVILVIDHCPPLFARARGEFPEVRVLASTGAPGVSGARNTGVRAATGDVVAFLDDDAVADRAWAALLLVPYADPDIIGVGGHAQPAWDEPRPRWLPREFDWVVGCSYRGLSQIPARVRNFIGANMSFRRDVLERLDGFRPDLGRIGTRPLGGEETELCIRAAGTVEGGPLLHYPAAVVHHRVRAERGRWRYFRARCYAEGLSKAAVSRHAGAGPALASERRYLRRTIPAAFLRPVRRGAGHQSWATLPALAIGVAWTVAGYVRERVDGLLQTANSTTSADESEPEPEPVRAVDRVTETADPAALPIANGRTDSRLHAIDRRPAPSIGSAAHWTPPLRHRWCSRARTRPCTGSTCCRSPHPADWGRHETVRLHRHAGRLGLARAGRHRAPAGLGRPDRGVAGVPDDLPRCGGDAPGRGDQARAGPLRAADGRGPDRGREPGRGDPDQRGFVPHRDLHADPVRLRPGRADQRVSVRSRLSEPALRAQCRHSRTCSMLIAASLHRGQVSSSPPGPAPPCPAAPLW